MKTEEQFLLKYMYEKGYTDEDIFDEKLCQSISYSMSFVCYKLKIKAAYAFAVLKKIALEAWASIKKALEPLYPLILEKHKPIPVPVVPYPSNFGSQFTVKNQVTDRKPKNKVRKIIR